jgi:hypothetical protein
MWNTLSLNRAGFAILVMGAALGLGGCSSDGTTTPPPVNEFAPPTGLTVVNGSGEVILRWQASTDAADADFKGYNVYRHTATMVGATDAQLLTYKRNTTYVTATTYTDATAQNGTKYYYAVRAARGSSELSTPTSEYDTAPRREGVDTIDLAEFRYTGQPSGLNCATPQAYTMESLSPDNRPFIDCYLGTLGTLDQTDQILALKSPDRVLNGDSRWNHRVAELVLLGTGQTAWDIPNAPTTGWGSQVELGAHPLDKVIAVKTPADTNGKRYYAKLWILGVTGDAGQRVISVQVAYQQIADYPRFTPAR